MKKEKKVKVTRSERIHNWISLKKLTEEFAEFANKYDVDVSNVILEADYFHEYEDIYPELILKVDSLETDVEYKERIERYNKVQARVEADELAELERLKKKYGKIKAL